MSAFVVSPAHITAILANYKAALESQRADVPDNGKLSYYGRALLFENCRSVASRYREEVSKEWEGYIFPDCFLGIPSPVAALRLCDSLEYQSCEHDGWEASPAFALLNKIRRTLIRALPGYNDNPWSL